MDVVMDALGQIHFYAVDLHLSPTTHIITSVLLSLYAVVVTRQRAGKKGVVQAFLYSFLQYRFMMNIVHFLVHASRVHGTMTTLDKSTFLSPEVWYLHAGVFAAVNYTPGDFVFTLATNEWVWPLVCTVFQLETCRGTYDAMANAEKSGNLPLYTAFIGLAVFYGPAWFRGDTASDRHDIMWAAIAFVLPQVIYDAVQDKDTVSRVHSRDLHIVGRICLYVQIISVLIDTPYAAFLGADSLGDRLQAIFDKVADVLPQPNGAKGKKAGTPAKAARRTASPTPKKR